MKELQEILDLTRLKLNRHEALFITPKFDVSLIANSLTDFISIPCDEYLLLFADLSKGRSKNALYITNQSIIRVGENGASEIGFDKIRKIMLDGPEKYSLLLNNTRFFDFPDHQHIAEVVIEFLADLQNINITALNLSGSEISYPKFSDIIDAVIKHFEKNKAAAKLEELYFKLSDSKFKTQIEDAIAKAKKNGNQTTQWDFYDEKGEKYYSSDKVQDIEEKMRTQVIKPDHKVMRTGEEEMKPVYEIIPQSESTMKKVLHPFTKARNNSFLAGAIVGLILGVIYFFILQDKYDVNIPWIVAGLVMIALGFISWEISKRKVHKAFKWVGVILPIAGAASILYGSVWLLITILSSAVITAILFVVASWIIHQRSKL